MNDKPKCQNCGGELAIEWNGHLETARCVVCNSELFATVYPGDEVSMIAPQPLGVRLHWRDGRMTPAEVIEVRKLIPAFREVPLSTLLADLSNSTTCDLGTFNRPAAVKLQAEAHALGLVVTLIPAPPAGNSGI
jgi:hypothetical protein